MSKLFVLAVSIGAVFEPKLTSHLLVTLVDNVHRFSTVILSHAMAA
jgi:hypothetical protein